MEISKKTAPIVQTFSEYLPEPFIDEISSNEKYYGWAPMGTSEDDEGWRIMKEEKTGTVTKRTYAQGTMDFVSSWTDRTSYNYSR